MDKTPPKKKPKLDESNYYLETINKEALNFDFKKVCSVSLSNVNVYCCLVCGKYFQGRSTDSYAYMHAVEKDHHVFINLETLKLYLLPENTELHSNSNLVQHIRDVIAPNYTDQDIKTIDTKMGQDMYGKSYIPGYIGLDGPAFITVALHLLVHLQPIRDFFLSWPGRQDDAMNILNVFGQLIKRMYCDKLFRNHVTPHELNKIIELKVQSPNPKNVLVWLFNKLHQELMVYENKKSSILSKSCQGKLDININGETSRQKFWILPLDFNDSSTAIRSDKINERITQISFKNLLSKYDGKTVSHVNETTTKTQKIGVAPSYLFIQIDRNLTLRNPTVVKFESPMDFTPYCTTTDTETVYELVGHVNHKFLAGDKLDHSDDSHDWQVSLQHQDEWLSINDLVVRPCNKELLFLEESYILVWKKLHKGQTIKAN